MSNERTIFLAAVEIADPEQRAAYLAQACGSDRALRESVDELLRANESAGSFLGESRAPFLQTVQQPAQTETVGTVIGPYRLLEQIGEGGFGVVYMAEQNVPVKRKVALKILKPGMDTREVIARFEAERQALALMDHPHIAKVLDAGATDSGRPYFVMELVRGVSITEYCDQYRLSPRERLELFVTVCQAVQHAHHKGIIHRDIKPTNVLVTRHDDRPLVKVIDFGIAKAVSGPLTEKTLFTRFAQMVGTPLYMSPEQAALSAVDIDTRSDIYSLGVLLYELLTGTTPFDKTRLQQAAYDEVRRIIREEEPQKPSLRLSSLGDTLPTVSAVRRMEPRKLSQLVRGDLDWIVMKALEKERARRYETANGFASDILRYLANEPVEACPPSASYRFRKFLKRNKGPAIASALILMSLVAGLIGTTTGLVQARRERDEKEAALREAEANFRKARQAVDDYFTLVSEETLLNEPAMELLRKKLLDEALLYYQDFVREHGDDPALQAELVAAYFRIAMITTRLGPEEDWLPAFKTGVELLEDLLQRDPPLSDLRSLETLAFRPHSGKNAYVPQPDEALRVFEQARILSERLVHDYPNVPGFQYMLARSHGGIAGLHLRNGDLGESLQSREAQLVVMRALVSENPDLPDYRSAMIATLLQLGDLLVRLHRVGEATDACREAMEIGEDLVAEFPDDPDWRDQLTGNLYERYAAYMEFADRFADAEAAYRKMLVGQEALMRDYPSVPRYRASVFRARLYLGDVLWAMGRNAEAADVFRPVAALGEQISDADLYEQDCLSWFLSTCADPQFRDPTRATEIARSLVQVDPESGSYWLSLGAAHYAGGNYRAAVQELERALKFPMGYHEVCCTGFQLAMAYAQLGENEQARRQYEQTLARINQTGPGLSENRRFRAEAATLLGIEQD